MKKRKGCSGSFVGHVLRRAILIALIVLLPNVAARAQNEANNWLFGDKARLNFSSGIPVAVSGSAMTTSEGSAVMSDHNGNLLFYTDGVTVWNTIHQPMPNGTGLMGHSSATQSAIIVPWPGKACQKYFIFTVGTVDNNVNVDLRYSIVDMTLSGGLGDVIPVSKNIVLKNKVSEKLTAVRDAAGTGFWVIAHGFDIGANAFSPSVNAQFYAFHVDSSGVSTSPTMSLAGTHYMTNFGGFPSQGQMKVSPDGTLIASAVRSKFVEILDFNNATGQVSGTPRTFDTSAAPFQSILVYGLEFSPNSKLLYVTTTGGSPNQLLQLDLTSSTPVWTQLFSSTGTGNYYDTGQLQLGPDKKIYVARFNKNYLSVIGSPNTAGTGANFVNIGPSLPPLTVSKLGLPNIISGDFYCTGTTTTNPTNPTAGCCDEISAIPSWKTKTTQDLRTFTITNAKVPASPICSIDISFNPPTTTQGALISIDSSPFLSTSLFVAPFNRIPNAGTMSALNSVKFSLSVNYSVGWTGTVVFVVNHCDGTTCALTYGPWTASPPPQTAAPGKFASNLMLEGRFATMRFQLLPAERKKPVKWISFSVDDAQGQLFAGTGMSGSVARGFPSTEVSIEDTGLDRTSVLYTFAQPLKSGEPSGTFELILSRSPSAASAPVIMWTTYDANGNAIETGTITSQQDIFTIPR